MKRKKLLVVTRHSPLPENDGAGAYLFELLSYLSSHGIQIRVVWVLAEGRFVNRGWWRVPRKFSSVARLDIIGSLPVGPLRIFRWGSDKARILSGIKAVLIRLGLWRVLKKRRSGENSSTLPDEIVFAQRAAPPRNWSATPTGLEESFFREHLESFEPDAVLANYCWMAPLLKGIDAQKLVLTHDVASHRWTMHKTPTPQESAEAAEKEADLLNPADHVLAISSDDARVFESMLPERNVLTVPKAAVATVLKQVEVSGRCLFVGGTNGPNREGLEWFLKEVWPLVRTAVPGAILHVCGGVCSMIEMSLPDGVVLRGRVNDLTVEYGEAQAVVVPLLRGTGVKIKLVEACSYGRPCVTTSVGLQGLPFLRESVIESEGAEPFAANVVRVLEDATLRQELHQRSISSVQKNLSREHCYSAVLAAIQESAVPAKKSKANLEKVP